MGDPLRDRRAAAELASNRQIVEFSEEINSFERFSAAVEADLATLPASERPTDAGSRRVAGTLAFSESEVPGVAAELSGRVEAHVTSVCQRCLEPFDWPLEVQLSLELVADGQAPAPREGFELWELDSAVVRPVDIVDEALVMALPLSPKHDNPASCVEFDAGDGEEEKIRPFAGLRARMDDDKRD